MRRTPELAPQFSDLDQQHDAATLGMWTFLGTEVLFFGGLIALYCAYRTMHPEGFAAAARQTQIPILAGKTAIMKTSSILVAWAVWCIRLNASRVAGLLLWGAAALGVLFLGLKGVEYAIEYREHLIPGMNLAVHGVDASAQNLFFAFYFVATGLHGIHVAIGIVVLIVIGFQSKAGTYSAPYHATATVAGLYWHFVDVVWIILFALIYLPGRS
jgi:cytochrome c oxidase subunit 3